MPRSGRSSPGGALPPLTFKGGNSIMKELQKAAAFQTFEEICTSGKTQNSDKLKQLAVQKYFGGQRDRNGDLTMGFTDILLKGQLMFAPLFKKEDNIPGYRGEQLVLRMDLFGRPQDTTKIVVSTQPGDLCLPILTSQSFSRRDNLTGRSIWSFGNEAVKVGRKLLAAVKNSEYRDLSLPSGTNYDDYIVFLRRAMFKLEEVPKMQDREKKQNDNADGNDEDPDLNHDATSDGGGEEEDEEDNSTNVIALDDNEADEFERKYMSKMSEKYYPSNLLSFLLFGPIQPEEADSCYQAKVFFCSKQSLEKMARKKDSKTEVGRASTRETNQKQMEDERIGAPTDDQRGLSSTQMFAAGNLAHAHLRHLRQHQTKEREQKYFFLENRVQQASKKEELYAKMVPQDHWNAPDGNVYDPDWRRSHFLLDQYLIAMELRKQFDDDLLQFMNKVSEQEEDNEEVQQLSSIVKDALKPAAKRPRLATQIRAQVRDSGDPPPLDNYTRDTRSVVPTPGTMSPVAANVNAETEESHGEITYTDLQRV